MCKRYIACHRHHHRRPPPPDRRRRHSLFLNPVRRTNFCTDFLYVTLNLMDGDFDFEGAPHAYISQHFLSTNHSVYE